jgi:hypothetical protein
VSVTSPDGTILAGQVGSLAGYRYESYDASDMARHLDSYLTTRPEWAILDHDKPGLKDARTARSAEWQPRLVGVTQADRAVSILGEMPAEAVGDLGAPRNVELIIEPARERGLQLTLILREKAANRMPEASFLTFAPKGARDWRYRKMGGWQDPQGTAPRGGGQLQAVAAVSGKLGSRGQFTVTPLDAPLVAPLKWPFMVFNSAQPDLSAGIRFNVHNNKWGTNFPMWWGGGLVARFEIEVAPA